MIQISEIFACNPACKSKYLGNKVCNLECMSKACGFDSGDCLVNCKWTGCQKSSSDGICDEDCNSNVCGFDFGDCGYCSEDCSEIMYNNNVCDFECDNAECLYDNFKCVFDI